MVDSELTGRPDYDIRVAQLWKSFFSQQSAINRNHLFDVYNLYARRIALALYKRYANYGVCADDFIQNAYLGLYYAIDRYRDNKGTRFETYAAYRIKGEILNGLQHYSDSFDLYQHRKKLEQERVVAILAVRGAEQDVKTLLSIALDVVTSSMVELAELDSAEHTGIHGKVASSELSMFGQKMMKLVTKIPIQYQQILMMHYFYEYSFAEIADTLGKSKSTVFKLHGKALESVRDKLSSVDKELLVV